MIPRGRNSKPHDGSDFQHRQKILPHYQTVATTKSNLKFTLVLHLMLSFMMGLKLLPNVFDALNIFWQPLEELYIPAAQTWEWIWFASTIGALLALKAIKTNNTLSLKIFLVNIVCFCMCPMIYCAYHYSADFRSFVITKDASKTSETWRGLPVALYWCIFIIVAVQVHGFELYSTWELIKNLNSPRSTSSNKRK